MAELGIRNPTLLDVAKATDPDGKIAAIVEILAETNEILDDMSWTEGNLVTGHRSTIRAGLPTPTWRKLYQGVQPTKGTTVQVTDNTGMLEDYAEIDKALADLNGNTPAFRLSEDTAHIEGLSQEMAETLFFGNEGVEPEAFTGLAPRYNDLSAPNAENIISAGTGTTDNQSIWLAVWGPQTGFGIVPKGSRAGLQMNDMGEITLQNVNGVTGAKMQAYLTHYRWDAGLTVRDWRYFVRICNISKAALTDDASSGPNLPNLMFDALERVPNLSSGRAAFYMSRTVRSFVRKQLSAAVKQSTLEFRDVGGRRTQFFQEVPMRRVDKLAADEAEVT